MISTKVNDQVNEIISLVSTLKETCASDEERKAFLSGFNNQMAFQLARLIYNDIVLSIDDVGEEMIGNLFYEVIAEWNKRTMQSEIY